MKTAQVKLDVSERKACRALSQPRSTQRRELKIPDDEPRLVEETVYVESFNGKLRDEFLAGEIFDTLPEAKVLVERRRIEHNIFRPHSSLGYRPPAPEAVPTPLPRRAG